VVNAILKSPLTLQLVDLVELITHEDQSALLLRLAQVLEGKPEAPAVLSGSAALAAMHQVLTDSASSKPPAEAPITWAGVVRNPAPWEQHPGKVTTWKVDYSRIRRFKGSLNTAVNPNSKAAEADALNVVYDEGCEVCTITRKALEKHYTAWAAGHPAFHNRPDIGKPRALYLQRPVNLQSFHGAPAAAPIMVLLHLRLQHAVYPVRCVVVDSAPGDVVLGLPFRRRYDVQAPYKVVANHKHDGQGLGVTHLTLGVPEGYGVSYPAQLAQKWADTEPAAKQYKQVLRLDTSWQTWRQTGKEMVPETLRPVLGLSLPK
jgi:hypothetical protein